TVYSISGSLVEFGSIANDQVNTSNLQPGMYLLHITDETGNGYTSSFIKL
ncbi:MAG: T9SS type A sorting domain-containing protein, partial [Chitinophagales bacterium]|nr:T9SS type A sorting domain-containing protein [Chitinophagales bacterium]